MGADCTLAPGTLKIRPRDSVWLSSPKVLNLNKMYKARAKKRQDKMVGLTKELLEPEERLVYWFAGQAGDDPVPDRRNPNGTRWPQRTSSS